MDGNSVGDNRLIRAIETGVPVPGTPEQAAELAGTRRANIVRCTECGEVGDRGYFGKNTAHPIPLPICVKCKAEADAEAEAKMGVLLNAIDAAFAPVVAAAKKSRTRADDNREAIADELAHFALGIHEDGHKSRVRVFIDDMLRHYVAGTVPDHFAEDEVRCDECNCLMTREEVVEAEYPFGLSHWTRECPCCGREADE